MNELNYGSVWKLAEKLHAHQKYDSREYGVHLSDVSNVLLMEVNGFHSDHPIVLASILHDTLEDTEFNYNDLAAATSVEIAEIVYDVTDELGRNRFERHTKTYPKTAANPKAILVKLADRIANTRHSKRGETRFFKMYRREYNEFREALYNETYFLDYPQMKVLWEILDEETWK